MKLRVGVLVVGSLDWESKDYDLSFPRELDEKDHERIGRRTKWRRNRLRTDAASEFVVRVPIRYGRKSGNRGNTFTMVFSPEYENRLGVAKAILCAAEVSSIRELVAEAEELWVAESSNSQRGKLSSSWGCVALVAPDDFLNHPDQFERRALLEGWAARASQEESYGKLKFSDEDIRVAGGPVIANGCLRMGWPKLLDGNPLPLDLLLATPTDPEIGSKNYPTAEDIAKAWNCAPKFVYYFRYNASVGIQTADDNAIERLLG